MCVICRRVLKRGSRCALQICYWLFSMATAGWALTRFGTMARAQEMHTLSLAIEGLFVGVQATIESICRLGDPDVPYSLVVLGSGERYCALVTATKASEPHAIDVCSNLKQASPASKPKFLQVVTYSCCCTKMPHYFLLLLLFRSLLPKAPRSPL